MRRLAFALTVLLAATVSAQVYRWVDKDGKVHYSDQKPPDAPADKLAIQSQPSDPEAAAPRAETLGLAIEFLEYAFAAVLGLVLRLARPEPFFQVAPESIEPVVRHFQKSAHEPGAVSVEEECGFRCIAVFRVFAVTVAL